MPTTLLIAHLDLKTLTASLQCANFLDLISGQITVWTEPI